MVWARPVNSGSGLGCNPPATGRVGADRAAPAAVAGPFGARVFGVRRRMTGKTGKTEMAVKTEMAGMIGDGLARGDPGWPTGPVSKDTLTSFGLVEALVLVWEGRSSMVVVA